MTKSEIFVSICCITYNHAQYIRQCLDGFLMQQTSFGFEILIHDDASTDGTEEIIREYEAKYPEIIKPLYETENQWIKGRRGSVVFNFPRAEGKYIALCEGDDYWTDPLKLQKQVDLLEIKNEVVATFHFSKIVDSNSSFLPQYYPVPKGNIVSTKSMIWNHYIPTNSLVFRSNLLEKIDMNLGFKLLGMDRFLELSISLFGGIFCIKETMSCHIKHQYGITASVNHQNRERRLLNNLNLILAVKKVAESNNFNAKVFYPKMATSSLNLTIHYIKNKDKLLFTYLKRSLLYVLEAPFEFLVQKIFKIR